MLLPLLAVRVTVGVDLAGNGCPTVLGVPRALLLVVVNPLAELCHLPCVVKALDLDSIHLGDTLAGAFDREFDVQQRHDNTIAFDQILEIKFLNGKIRGTLVDVPPYSHSGAATQLANTPSTSPCPKAA